MTGSSSRPSDSRPSRDRTEQADKSSGAPIDAWLAPLLVRSNLLTQARVDELLAASVPALWPAAAQRGWLNDTAVAAEIAKAYKIEIADLKLAEPRMTTLIPERVARKHRVVPITANDRTIDVATADPRDLDLEQTLGFVTGREVRFKVASPTAIAARLDELYRPERAIERLLDGLAPVEVQAVETPVMPDSHDPALEAPVSRLVDAMISDAVRDRASDIHAEPTDGAFVVRYRVDGVMREVMRLPEAAGAALVRRVKVWAKLDVTDPLRPHDGRASARVGSQIVDLRVSTIPIARRGEKAVIRILDKTNLGRTLDTLGLPAHELSLIDRLLGHREGMVLLTGPTGSGKTTTLYAALNQLKTGKVNIVTVEDPVEYEVGGISQIQVNEAQGLTFARALRSVLRQDPDIVLVGEIRDLETAVTAVQAGFSGHFVLSTLHTNDAPSAVVRLRDLGVDAFKIAAVLKGVIAQRLVRVLCEQCAESVPLESLPPEARPPVERDNVQVRKAVGCRACNGIGYRGRTNILEIMPVDEHVARLIEGGALPEALASAARKIGMRTLWESGLERVWNGTTSLEELIRVLGERVQDDDGSTSTAAPLVPALSPRAQAAAVPASGAGPATGSTATASTAPAAAGGQHILIADDDPQMRRLIRGVLEREGYAVSEVSDGLDTLDIIERGGIDLVILDYDMPRLDGLGVLEELRAQVRTATLPVIMLTARNDETEEKALDLGAQDYLTKPVQTRSLTARVKAVLKRADT